MALFCSQLRKRRSCACSLPGRAFKLPRKQKKAFLAANGADAYKYLRLRFELRSPAFRSYCRSNKDKMFYLLEELSPRFDAFIEQKGWLSFYINLKHRK